MSEEVLLDAVPSASAPPASRDGAVEAIAEDEAAEALLESLLVEEVSIDGMCGVY
jgi:mycofactocin precursor